MPQKLARPCSCSGCPGLAELGTSYCKAHTKLGRRYDDRRGTASKRGYDARWLKIRAMVLAEEPLCRACGEQGKTTVASMVHHADGNPRNNDETNLVPLCTACHGKVRDE